jgi:hypothetical protein
MNEWKPRTLPDGNYVAVGGALENGPVVVGAALHLVDRGSRFGLGAHHEPVVARLAVYAILAGAAVEPVVPPPA